MKSKQGPAERSRLRVAIRGVVQGVGFRPFVYRLAREYGLVGWVRNGPEGVLIEIEGATSAAERFIERLEAEPPPHARIVRLEFEAIRLLGESEFRIHESDTDRNGARLPFVVPDIATCGECLEELFDVGDRRFRYPFINCTHCGPRYSIIEAVPYDRSRTSMRTFRMCPECQSEYENPESRRFHAQPNACARCGPKASLLGRSGTQAAVQEPALRATVERLRGGEIVAVQGIGGFHLWTLARDEEAVARLRRRKAREAKPFAVMAPSLASAREWCVTSECEESLLTSPEAPIVLMTRREPTGIAPSVAPDNPNLGVMLPNAPLHHLLSRDLGETVVATSGNRRDEPICHTIKEAIERLSGIADAFLVHDRPIVRAVDDSIVRVIAGRPMVLRRARGYAPFAIRLGGDFRESATAAEPGPAERARRKRMEIAPERRAILALGGQQKGAVAVSDGAVVFLGQHLGDLETPENCQAYRRCVTDLEQLFQIRPAVLAVDAHPDYFSTRFGRERGLPIVTVQHHDAHVAGCLAENGVGLPVLGVAWDGTGDGMDGTVWGGEFLRVGSGGFVRVARLRPFRLPGGEAAIRQPRRVAFSLLHEMGLVEPSGRTPAVRWDPWTPAERTVLEAMSSRGVGSPVTTSAGRLFDAVASLLGLRHENRFEGEAAMALEFAAEGEPRESTYPFGLRRSELLELDWEPTIRALIGEQAEGRSVGTMAARFQDTLAEMILAVAREVGESTVVLSGGCFQNRRLTEGTIDRLREGGFRPVWHRDVPPNDGGLALGQVVAALRQPE